MEQHFTFANWVIVAVYILGISVIGSLFYRKRTSASEYFLGGRKMRVVPVAISLVAADMSAISYMGTPAWTYEHNFELFLSVFVLLLAAPVVMYLFMPFYSRFKFFTGYEYLERRFDLKTRLLGSGLFLLTRGSHVAIVIYAPSVVLSLLTGISLVGCILLIGVLTTFYTTLGGMKAVIWTDVIQFSILVTGICTVLWLSISRIPGGFLTAYHLSSEAGRFHLFNWSLNPNELTTVWATVFGGGVMVLSTLGTDQAYLQRYFANQSLKEERRSVLLDVLIAVPVSGLLYFLGTVLYVFYRFHPSHLIGLTTQDAILPFFVVHELQGVLPGLIIASIFAASMAVVSAGINSLTTVTTLDFYERLLHRNKSGAGIVLAGRLGTIGWGLAATGAALFANRLGPLINAFSIINAFLGGPILGLFLLGMLSRRAKGTASTTGAVVGLIVVSVVAWNCSISFFYYSLIGLVATLVVGYSLSLIGPAPDPAELSGLVRGLEPSHSELSPYNGC
jgi:SSS family transporter